MKKSVLVQIIKEAVTAKRLLKEEKSVDQLMSALGNAILADDNEAMKAAFKDLKTGLIGRIKNKAEKIKSHLEDKYTNEGIEEDSTDFNYYLNDSDNVIKTKDGYVNQETQYSKVFRTKQELYDWWKREYGDDMSGEEREALGSEELQEGEDKLIKRKDGSKSKKGLWDNMRDNKGSGKKPTKEMLAQEKKIESKDKKK